MKRSGSSEGHAADLPARVLQAMTEQNLGEYLLERPLVVGVSGGADSLALLHVLCSLRGPRAKVTLHVAHLDHGFRGEEGAADAEFVARIAREWGIPITLRRFDVPEYARLHRLSTEDAARRVRYSFLAALAERLGATVTVAHNADDQVETALLNVLRGTGLAGLRAMSVLGDLPIPAHVPEFEGLPVRIMSNRFRVFRPLLGVWRAELTGYCDAVGLEPRVDRTNFELNLRRNRVRHELIPVLQDAYNPSIKESILRLAHIAADDDAFIEQFVDEKWSELAVVSDGHSVRFECARFAELPVAIRRRLARRAISRVAGTLDGVGFEHIERALQLLSGLEASPSEIHLPHTLTVYRDATSAVITTRSVDERQAMLPEETRTWPVVAPGVVQVLPTSAYLSLGEGWGLSSEVIELSHLAARPGDLVALFDWDELRQMPALLIRGRRPGDYIHPLGMEGRKSLQDLYVDAKIPARLRDRLAVITRSEKGGEVLWVPGPGGRRSRLAPLQPKTERVLKLEFVRSSDRGGDTSSVGY